MPYFSYMCLVSGIEDGKVLFDPTVGCDQGGPTPETPGKAWDWYIENVKEECDSPGEYFYDTEVRSVATSIAFTTGLTHLASSLLAVAVYTLSLSYTCHCRVARLNRNGNALQEEALYYTFNGTETPTGNEQLSLTHTKVIFNITGSMAMPVKNIIIRGLTISDAAFTYLGTDEASRHWLPSEGDWALQRSGAIHIEGAEGITIDRNQLTRNDGNAIFLGGYSRGVNITANDFNWIGDSVIAAFGWTSDCLHADCAVKLPAKVGPDGRGGEQPRNAYIGGNLFRYVSQRRQHSRARARAHTITSTRAPTHTLYYAYHYA
eukprot:SAG25_NODE_621_length_6407_cov_3.818643_1_plen_319_part_00